MTTPDPARPRRPRRTNVSPRMRLLDYLSSKYGLTLADYDHLLGRQKGTCAVCHQPPRSGRRLHIDHDHQTGLVRALLCNRCNSALGIMGENPLALSQLAHYAEHCVQVRVGFTPDAGDDERQAIAVAYERDPHAPYLVNAMRQSLQRLYTKPVTPAKRAPWNENLVSLAYGPGAVAAVRAGSAHEAVFV